jgi:ABC-type Na+ efflux pump permease subunit
VAGHALDRRGAPPGTFELLLCTTLSSRSILFGKTMAAILPTAPMMALSSVLLILGVPHLELFSDGGMHFGGLVVGLLAFVWTLPVWLLAVVASMTLALRSPRPAGAFGVVMVSMVLLFGLPAVLAHIFPAPGWRRWPGSSPRRWPATRTWW